MVVDATGNAASMANALNFVGFAGRLVFVGITALMAIVSYLVIVGEIKRVDLVPASAR